MWYICDTFVLHKNTGSIIKVPWTQGMFSSRHETSWHTVFLGRFCYCWLLLIHPQCFVRPENSPAHSHMWITLLFGVTALWGGRPSMAAGIDLKGLTKKRPVLQQWHKCSCIIVMLKLDKEQALRLLSASANSLQIMGHKMSLNYSKNNMWLFMDVLEVFAEVRVVGTVELDHVAWGWWPQHHISSCVYNKRKAQAAPASHRWSCFIHNVAQRVRLH